YPAEVDTRAMEPVLGAALLRHEETEEEVRAARRPADQSVRRHLYPGADETQVGEQLLHRLSLTRRRDVLAEQRVGRTAVAVADRGNQEPVEDAVRRLGVDRLLRALAEQHDEW